MAISLSCPSCQRKYQVSETHAGKKFRCKECESIVTVPEVPVAAPVDDLFGFDTPEHSDGDAAGGNGDWDYGEPLVRPKRKPSTQKRPSPSTRRGPSSGGSNNGAKIGAAVGGGLFVVLFVGLIVLRVKAGGVDFLFGGASWTSYTTPGGEVTFDVPGRVTTGPGGPLTVPGSMMYLGETRDFACGVIIEPMPLEFQGLSEQEILDAMQTGLPLMGAYNVRATTLQGQPSVTHDMSQGEFFGRCTCVVGSNNCYNFIFLYKDEFDQEAEARFLNSIRIHH